MNSDLLDLIVAQTIRNVGQEFPYSQSRVFESADDFQLPREQHPIFYGSYDWHSCVHSYWLLVRALAHGARHAHSEQITALFDRQLTAEKVAVEMAFFSRSAQAGFERPYGWVWLLKLAGELKNSSAQNAPVWFAALSPFAVLIAERLKTYLPKLKYPIRSGIHNNTAFALLLALDYATAVDDFAFRELLNARALFYFGHEPSSPCNEPGGEDFLSPAWQQALLMQKVMPPRYFLRWMTEFFSRSEMFRTAGLFSPVETADRSDGRLAHLDGLNLSKAWCMAQIAESFAAGSLEHSLLSKAADAHLQASQDHLYDHYMGGHWLATFLFLALDL